MSKRKGVSADDKRDRILQIFRGYAPAPAPAPALMEAGVTETAPSALIRPAHPAMMLGESCAV